MMSADKQLQQAVLPEPDQEPSVVAAHIGSTVRGTISAAPGQPEFGILFRSSSRWRYADMTALSVLVVEDDAMLATSLTEMLEDMGYNVCAIAATEDGAVSEAARCKPGLLIVDEQLREGSGASAVARILRAGSIPCIFMSGARRDPTRPGAIMLQKPFHGKDLARAIRHVVGSADTPATLTPAPAYRVPHG